MWRVGSGVRARLRRWNLCTAERQCSLMFPGGTRTLSRISTRDANEFVGEECEVNGWVRSVRKQKSVAFIELNDGSNVMGLQVICSPQQVSSVTSGSSVTIRGQVEKSPKPNQPVELHASEVIIVGTCDPELYPLQKKYHSPEFLREISQLRPRARSFGCIHRIRSQLSHNIHSFFHQNCFLQLHAPCITSMDCEGAGELFRIDSATAFPHHTSTGPPVVEQAEQEQEKPQSFFGLHSTAYMTVSAQFHAEILACGLSKAYSFGPIFRADNSNTSRHLAEFWMVEPEVAFTSLPELIDLLQRTITYCMDNLDKVMSDIQFLRKETRQGGIQASDVSLHSLAKPIQIITYESAVKELQKHAHHFTRPVDPLEGLGIEHEKFICEKMFDQTPVCVTHYPTHMKPFYMKQSPDNPDVVENFDLLVPGLGELAGGSMREHRLDNLLENMKRNGLAVEAYQWYLDLRRYGTVPHGGWGVGFDRLVQAVTGVSNIRDVVLVPRVPNSLQM